MEHEERRDMATITTKRDDVMRSTATTAVAMCERTMATADKSCHMVFVFSAAVAPAHPRAGCTSFKAQRLLPCQILQWLTYEHHRTQMLVKRRTATLDKSKQ